MFFVLRLLRANQLPTAALTALLLGVFYPTVARSFAPAGSVSLQLLSVVGPLLVLLVAFDIAKDRRFREQLRGAGSVLCAFVISTACCALSAATLSYAVISYGFSTWLPPVSDIPTPKLWWTPPPWILPGALATGLVLGCILSTEAQRITSSVKSALMNIIRRTAPIGIFCLLCTTFAGSPFEFLRHVGSTAGLMVIGSLLGLVVINPCVAAVLLRRSPAQLAWDVLRRSALPAFASRSSLANIPFNLELCEAHGVPGSLSNIAIPLGAVFNMPGAAVTMAALLTLLLGPQVGLWAIPTAALLAFGASFGIVGIPNGTGTMLPTIFAFLALPPDQQLLGMGLYFAASVVQDPFGTALNSSSDAFLTIATYRRSSACPH